jgi:hypothetical protein
VKIGYTSGEKQITIDGKIISFKQFAEQYGIKLKSIEKDLTSAPV